MHREEDKDFLVQLLQDQEALGRKQQEIASKILPDEKLEPYEPVYFERFVPNAKAAAIGKFLGKGK